MSSIESARKVLVTGGAGFIGSHLCESLVKLGVHVKCFDNLSTGRRDHISRLLDEPNFKFIEGDLQSLSEVEEAVASVDVVFHLAARVGVKLV